MYCINCGVKLADSEKKCPLCGTIPFHPDIRRDPGESLYPQDSYPLQQVSRKGVLGVITILLLIPILVTLICDLGIHSRVTWSGYVVGAIAVAYIIAILPRWFSHPNPVVFVPCAFGSVGVYVLYIDLSVHGGWFLSFAFPVVGCLGLLVTAVVVLTRYTHRGELFIYGGALATLGIFMPLMEYLMVITFPSVRFIGWSLYPLVILVLMGGALIFLAVCRPARETVERKIFL